MPDSPIDPLEPVWEAESSDAFLQRVEHLVTGQDASLPAMRHLRELAIRYEARAQFLVDLKEQFEQALLADRGLPKPERENLEELLAEHEEEIRAEWDATEPIPDVTILEMLWPGDPPNESP